MDMNLSSVYHRASEQFCYSLDENHLIINLRTGCDISKVFIHYGDFFSDIGDNDVFTTVREEISTKRRLKHHLWWTAIVKPPFKRCHYFFELVCGDQVYFYFENNFFTKEQIDSGRFLQRFDAPWMNKSDIISVPKWVNDTVWYQILPDRFANGDPSINHEKTLSWECTGNYTRFDYFSGDLQGVIDKLDYLKDLGITGIYFTPINESKSYHCYDTSDYYKIDPALGNSETLKTLVLEAHKRGIRIMLDVVFNHCGDLFPLWQDVFKKGPGSKYYKWFLVNKWPFEDNSENAKKGYFHSFSFLDFMPKINTSNPEVVQYFSDICEYWIKEFDIDGMRLDATNELPHTFIRELRKVTKSLKDDFFILGEMWHDAMPWLLGDQLDSVTNYSLTEVINDIYANKDLTKDYFEKSINSCYTMYMQQINDVLFNLLDSHDTTRIINKLNHNLNQMYQQLGILFTLPGSVCIYYGTEIAIEGKYGNDGRRCMPWDKIEAGEYDDKIAVMKKLINIRKNNALKGRNITFTQHISNERVIEYIKSDEAGNQVEVIVNCSMMEVQIADQGDILFDNLYDGGTLKPDGILIRKM